MKSLTSHQADLQLQQVSDHFEMKSKTIEDKIAHIHISEQQKSQKLQEEQRAQDTEKVSAYILLNLLGKCFHKVMYIILFCTTMFVKKNNNKEERVST